MPLPAAAIISLVEWSGCEGCGGCDCCRLLVLGSGSNDVPRWRGQGVELKYRFYL